ncbi:protein BCCIP homolog [Pocillopora damicornis]|uniref:protein BCCIP homolog n=1 Tax=Pocillopora damicornis TaxID=46731 RepID=UPI000F550FB6|nr:protein BCCIP homolog [Pocillopora damicornis]
MADSSSDSDDVGEKSLQKGEKRRQEESDEDSDEDSSSDVNTDGSDESFDENMEIPVEFEAFPPNEEDFNGIRCLLQQLFLKSTLDLSKLSDLIISQPEVTTLIKVVNDDDQENNGEAKTDNDDNDDESEDGVFGLTTVIDLKKHKVNEREFLKNFSFIFVRSELKKVHKKGDDAPISYFVMICKTYKDTETKMHKKSKKVKTQESGSSLSFINVEDEVFQRESQLSFSYAASADVDETLVAGRWASSDCELKPYRTVLVLPADKFDKALEGIHNMLTQ